MNNNLKQETMDLFNSFRRNETAQIIGGVITAIFLLSLAVTGFSFLYALLVILLFAVVILIGALNELFGSIVICFLLKILLPEIKQLTVIWFTSPKINQMFGYIENISYAKLILIIFLAIFTLSFVTKSIKLFHVNAGNMKN
ncbi:MAG: hypothetical protein ACOYL8_02815 [Patescibacteria group bacterium]